MSLMSTKQSNPSKIQIFQSRIQSYNNTLFIVLQAKLCTLKIKCIHRRNSLYRQYHYAPKNNKNSINNMYLYN